MKTNRPSNMVFHTREEWNMLWELCLGAKEEEGSTEKVMPDLGFDV